jgi:predicted dehydrogenase
MLANPQHWVRRLPGKLLHNLISHGIARVAEFLDDELTHITAIAAQSPTLHGRGADDVLDELRVIIRDISGTTASFTFSTQIKPRLNQLRLFGPSNSIVVNNSSGTIVRHRNRSFKSYLTFFIPPVLEAWENLSGSAANMTNFARRRLYQDSGMTELIRRFYQSITAGGAPAIPHREIVLTARIMDEVFRQIYASEPRQKARSAEV